MRLIQKNVFGENVYNFSFLFSKMLEHIFTIFKILDNAMVGIIFKITYHINKKKHLLITENRSQTFVSNDVKFRTCLLQF